MNLQDAERLVNECLYVTVHQNQFNALASLARDIGEYNFKRSKLLNYVNIGTNEAMLKAANLFTSYGKSTHKSKKQQRASLKQRKADREMFLTPVAIYGGRHDKAN